VLPPLDPDKEAALRASIETDGVIEPVIVDQYGRILDGHHRARIADELGVEYRRRRFEVDDDDHAQAVALKLNTLRRQIDPELRAKLALNLREQGHTLEAIGAALGVHRRTVERDLATCADAQVPERIIGRDGKSRPATRRVRAVDIHPGDEVTDEHGDEREVAAVERVGDEMILFDEEGEAIITGTDTTVQVRDGSIAPAERPSKPDLGAGVSHPARFSWGLMPWFVVAVPREEYPRVLDPFAGTGRIHELPNETVGIEIEPEWAAMHPDTQVGNALDLPFGDESFDAVVTSPTYGNRFADSHNAKDGSVRRSYTHDLGRKLSDGSSGAMQWGGKYRDFHVLAWEEVWRVLRPGGRFVLNVKDHDRQFTRQCVTAWHVTTIMGLGFELRWFDQIDTGGLRQGENADERYPEQIIVFDKPGAP
jgi:ParB-like chromosome segregation protein Spo0J/SAM-dependent methyltransferase